MKKFKPKSIVRPAIPVLCALLGVWLMTGCFVVPIWPTRKDKTQYDYRSDVGDEKSNKPVRPGAISRSEIIKRFGSPNDFEHDQSIGYRLSLNTKKRVWPLCFHSEIAREREHTLILHFDKNGMLIKYDLSEFDYDHKWLN